MPENERRDLERAFAAIVDEASGEVTLDGRSFVLVERETLADIQRGMEEILGRGAASILVRAGYARGARLAVRLSTLVDGQPASFVNGLRVFAARTGLCRFEELRTEGSRVTVRVTNSFIGQAYGRSPRPVCDYLRGFLLAVAEHLVHRKDLECHEQTCVAMGDDTCRFEILPALRTGSSTASARDVVAAPPG